MPCRLKVRLESVVNLPKLSKGPGGCDPFVVLEIMDSEHVVLVGGERELNCDACRTKPLRRVLEGYFEESFDFKVNTNMVREECIVQLRLLNAKTPPEPHKGVGFFRLSLLELARKGGAKETIKCDLLALGEVVNTYGNKYPHGTELKGYRDPYAASTLEFSVEMLSPPLVPNEIVPPHEQLAPWDFYLLAPAEQDTYDHRIITLASMLVAQQQAEEQRLRLKRLQDKKVAHERLMAKKLKDPMTWRTNWKELQENIQNDLFRRGMSSFLSSFEVLYLPLSLLSLPLSLSTAVHLLV